MRRVSRSAEVAAAPACAGTGSSSGSETGSETGSAPVLETSAIGSTVQERGGGANTAESEAAARAAVRQFRCALMFTSDTLRCH